MNIIPEEGEVNWCTWCGNWYTVGVDGGRMICNKCKSGAKPYENVEPEPYEPSAPPKIWERSRRKR